MFYQEWYKKIKKDRSVGNAIKKIEKSFIGSKIDLPLFYKLRIAEFVIRLKKRFHKKFGIFIIFGWRQKWKDFADTPDITQNIFKNHHVRVFEFHKKELQDLSEDRFMSRHIAKLIKFDGAILIDKHGVIVDSGVYIEGLRPKTIAEKLYPGHNHKSDLSAVFGFKTKVHARHLSAISASYIFKNTAVYTLSEETGDFHVFERGKIVYSSVVRERSARTPRRL